MREATSTGSTNAGSSPVTLATGEHKGPCVQLRGSWCEAAAACRGRTRHQAEDGGDAAAPHSEHPARFPQRMLLHTMRGPEEAECGRAIWASSGGARPRPRRVASVCAERCVVRGWFWRRYQRDFPGEQTEQRAAWRERRCSVALTSLKRARVDGLTERGHADPDSREAEGDRAAIEDVVNDQCGRAIVRDS